MANGAFHYSETVPYQSVLPSFPFNSAEERDELNQWRNHHSNICIWQKEYLLRPVHEKPWFPIYHSNKKILKNKKSLPRTENLQLKLQKYSHISYIIYVFQFPSNLSCNISANLLHLWKWRLLASCNSNIARKFFYTAPI